MVVFDLLKDLLIPYKGLVFSGMFLTFFVFLAVAIAANQDTRIRKAFLAFFFACLLLTTLSGQHVLPFTQWHKFSNTADQNATTYSVEMVTEDGTRIPLDSDITGFAAESYMASSFVSDYTEEERRHAAIVLIQRANNHRHQELQPGINVAALLSFPPHGYGAPDWNTTVLRKHGKITGIIIVKDSLTFAKDDTTIRNHITMDECVYELDDPVKHNGSDRSWGVAQCS